MRRSPFRARPARHMPLWAPVFPVFLVLAGCASDDTGPRYPTRDRHASEPTYGIDERGSGLLGSLTPDALESLFGSNDPETRAGIGVNSFLWQALLDTINFMPLASADPFGGVVLTDWYAPGDAPNERFKMNALIIGKALKADAIRINLFRQVRGPDGGWQDAAVKADATAELENLVLTRARQLRMANPPE